MFEMGLEEQNSSAKTIPENSEAGPMCRHSTKLEIPFPADDTHDLRQVGPANFTSVILDS